MTVIWIFQSNVFYGGSMGNDPRYFWLFNSELQEFVLNETLTKMSDFVSFTVGSDGYLRAFHRDGQQWTWLTLTYDNYDNDFTITLTEEWKVLEANWTWTGYVSLTITDHITETQTVTIKPWGVMVGIEHDNADFVQRRMDGERLREHYRVICNDRVYDLFSTFQTNPDCFWGSYETWVFISAYANGEYEHLQSIEIIGRGGNAIGGLVFADIDFDGADDLLVWQGHFGVQMLNRYAAFLNRDGKYKWVDFDIPNPSINSEKQRISGTTRNHSASHFWFMYAFDGNEFVLTDEMERTWEWDYDSGELGDLVIRFFHIDGEKVDITDRGEAAEQMYNKLFSEGGWAHHANWFPIFPSS